MRLLQILLGVELPTLAFVLGRMIFLRTLTPLNIVFLGTAAVSIAAYTYYIFKPMAKQQYMRIFQMLTAQAAVVLGMYASILMFFFLPIFLAWLGNEVVGPMWSSWWKYGFGHINSSNFRVWETVTGIAVAITLFTVFLFLILSPFIGLFFLLASKSATRKSTSKEVRTQCCSSDKVGI